MIPVHVATTIHNKLSAELTTLCKTYFVLRIRDEKKFYSGSFFWSKLWMLARNAYMMKYVNFWYTQQLQSVNCVGVWSSAKLQVQENSIIEI